MEEGMTYEKAYNELEQITKEIENEIITVDVLADKVKRASELVEFCREKLRSAELEINKIISNRDPQISAQ
ncbi:exodeoxyribonuclease VII small subunit [Flavobacterium subsaxonicum]|uniref:Exodeoxyribonuclease 7 small subunit n=1 Tax=Flavobacterium subsaxonicum WB 4.1-42 = DSM 21790 TaxID=1121898 RepID=A0A0A2MZK9_9FLAO|nr:exodeoxyribonuclease VII small subunit [Flavobacterium subsaxonicum]KGO93640.1 exonuclease VII small subunit [Flavobacterium subsaxonicum WB 4.1-42 = DSM 21790]